MEVILTRFVTELDAGDFFRCNCKNQGVSGEKHPSEGRCSGGNCQAQNGVSWLDMKFVDLKHHVWFRKFRPVLHDIRLDLHAGRKSSCAWGLEGERKHPTELWSLRGGELTFNEWKKVQRYRCFVLTKVLSGRIFVDG